MKPSAAAITFYVDLRFQKSKIRILNLIFRSVPDGRKIAQEDIERQIFGKGKRAGMGAVLDMSKNKLHKDDHTDISSEEDLTVDENIDNGDDEANVS